MFSISSQLCFVYIGLQQVRSIHRSDQVQNMIGFVSLSLGGYGGYQLYRTCKIDPQESPSTSTKDHNYRRAIKIIKILGQVSFIVGALVSKPVLTVCHISLCQLLTPTQLHLLGGAKIQLYMSWIGIILGLPSTIKTTYDCYYWCRYQIRHMTYKNVKINKSNFDHFLKNFFLNFNTCSSPKTPKRASSTIC